MAGVNKVIIVGNLGNDPEVKYMQSGDAIATISVATSETWKDKQTGERREKTEWHRIVMFKRLAEIAGEYLRKGSKVYIEGKLQTRKWQGQDGTDRYTTEIVADQMQMLDSRGAGQGVPMMGGGASAGDTMGGDPGYGGASARPQGGGSARKSAAQPQSAPPSNFDDFEDDIPF